MGRGLSKVSRLTLAKLLSPFWASIFPSENKGMGLHETGMTYVVHARASLPSWIWTGHSVSGVT